MPPAMAAAAVAAMPALPAGGAQLAAPAAVAAAKPEAVPAAAVATPARTATAAEQAAAQMAAGTPPTGGPRERKKGVPWTEDEHRLFLLGLQKLGKGDWRGISRHYVKTRTPTQVASHAQKYFIRQNNLTKRKRRASLFDIVSDANDPATVAAQEAAANTVPA